MLHAQRSVMTLLAREPDLINEEELRLLRELGGDISFALDHLEKEAKLDYLAFYDALTGLPNRTLFQDRVNRMVPLALGTQTGGSVLRPAAFCGIVGFKPTFDAINTVGVNRTRSPTIRSASCRSSSLSSRQAAHRSGRGRASLLRGT